MYEPVYKKRSNIMELKYTIEILTKDIQDIENLVGNLQNSQEGSAIELDLALAKLRNVYEILTMIKADRFHELIHPSKTVIPEPIRDPIPEPTPELIPEPIPEPTAEAEPARKSEPTPGLSLSPVSLGNNSPPNPVSMKTWPDKEEKIWMLN